MPTQKLTSLARALCALGLTIGLAACGSDTSTDNQAFSVAVIGDLPYGFAAANNSGVVDNAQFLAIPAFFKFISDDKDLAMVFHGGDIHSGKEYCTEAFNKSVLEQLRALALPIVYTPGDNEWADCHKKKQGGGLFNTTTSVIDYVKDATGALASYAGGDPLANLSLVRSLFFPAPGKTLGVAMDVTSQAKAFDPAYPSDSQYVENVRFKKGNVVFVTLNIPGGSNNDTDAWYYPIGSGTRTPQQDVEVANRTAANLRWLKAAFAQANAEGASAVAILVQGDMWDPDNTDLATGRAHITQLKTFIDEIASSAKTFTKPVLLMNGDSHVYRSDNPLVPGADCYKEPIAIVGGVDQTTGTIATKAACADVPGRNVYGTDASLNQAGSYSVPNFHRIVWHGSTLPFEYIKLRVDPSVNAAYSFNPSTGAEAFGPFSWTRVVKK